MAQYKVISTIEGIALGGIGTIVEAMEIPNEYDESFNVWIERNIPPNWDYTSERHGELVLVPPDGSEPLEFENGDWIIILPNNVFIGIKRSQHFNFSTYFAEVKRN